MSFFSNRLTLSERWLDVLSGWEGFIKNPDKADGFVHFLIHLDSYAGYLEDQDIYELLGPVRELMSHMETQDPEHTNMASIEGYFQKVTRAISEITDPDYVRKPPTVGLAEVNGDNPEGIRAVFYCPSADDGTDMAGQVEHYGYLSETKPDLTAAVKHAIASNAGVVVVDVSHVDHITLADAMAPLRRAHIPWVALNDKNDFNSRLAMVRAQCGPYLVKPTTAVALVEAMDSVTLRKADEPYRVLVVEDSTVMVHFLGRTLSRAGIMFYMVHKAEAVLPAVEDFAPDLILLDFHLPDCTGIEVAKIIRQHEAYVSIPIVYLSGETKQDIQLEAIRGGGDEFLTKPIDEGHLLSVVSSKVDRYRSLRKFMIQDSLTGLLNHTRTKQQLVQLVSLAGRENTGVAFVMVDIDYFKKVNDSYGHYVGDRVIKALARLLQQRVRKSDVVGRYGGEEFAIVLYDLGAEQAVSIMNKIRVAFSEIYHPYDDGIFRSTFSCGIAMFPDFADATDIGVAADKALYLSKHGGRNLVSLAGPGILDT